jgi:4-hydroxybenzoate polyprenyltransferase
LDLNFKSAFKSIIYFQRAIELYIVGFYKNLKPPMTKVLGQLPLCVDLDGTLLRTDTLVESLVALVRQNFFSIGAILLALLRGRARFKAWVAERLVLDITSLPLNQAVLDWLRSEYEAGRPLVLVTAADSRVAKAVADHTGLFSEVLASNGSRNLKAAAKAEVLVSRFGRHGFDYAGNARADLPVWRVARRAIVVGTPGLQQVARQVADVERVFPTQGRTVISILRAMRLHQWVKNLLVFIPLLAAHKFTDGSAPLAAGLAFVAFGFTASAVYLLNDLLDLSADRQHPQKCHRPFASGHLALLWGLILPPLFLLAALTLCLLWLPMIFLAVLVGYFITTLAYSFKLKSVPIIDVMTLAGLYTIRVIAGAAAVAITPSFWLLAFSMFIFLSLALVKRYTELKSLRERGELIAAGRGWHVDDLPLVSTIGTSAGVACVLVMALYIDSQSAEQLYSAPHALWLICPLLLYWVSRLWFKAHRGEVHEDPIVFALTDWVSLVVGLLATAIVIFASYGFGT